MESLGCSVIDADEIARKIWDTYPECLENLLAEFGNDIRTQDGSINRKLLAKRAFTSRDKTKKLSEITHPFIMKELTKKLYLLKKEDKKIIILDVPLLFEIGADKMCDAIILVKSDESIRTKRIMQRDNIDKAMAELRIFAQKSFDSNESYADYIIDCSNSDKKKLYNNVNNLLKKIISGFPQ